MNDLKASNSFISFITSIESLLLSENETIRGLLAERVALIVADKYDSRIKYFEQMLRLYKLRSELVHRGLNNIAQGDIHMLSFLLFLVIRKMILISGKINTSAELIDKIKRMKFSAPRFRAL